MRVFILGAIVGILTTWGGYHAVKATGNDKFCLICHSMDAAGASYKTDAHGANGKLGIKVACVSCHLPHDSVINYIYTKALNGLKEITITALNKDKDIDWLEKRKDRERFVYDSGCVSCHNENLANKSPKAKQMHAHYKKLLGAKDELKCVSCHINVGHGGILRGEINKISPEFK